jgi:hypothetical protein
VQDDKETNHCNEIEDHIERKKRSSRKDIFSTNFNLNLTPKSRFVLTRTSRDGRLIKVGGCVASRWLDEMMMRLI